MRLRRFLGFGAAAIILLPVACDSDGGTTASGPSTTTTTSPAPTAPVDDGVLRLGVLRPASADSADIANSAVAGVKLAVEHIRSAGVKVELFERDEGGNSVTERSINELVDVGVSAIIGPMSSNVALSNLADIVRNNVLACSPTASSLALDEFPDRGLFFRTIPSDSMQASAIARLVDRTGARSTALLYLDDNYGRPLADAVQRQLGDQIPVQRMGFSGSDASISAVVAQMSVVTPDTAIVIADAKTAAPLITAADAALNGAELTFVVNDLVRRAFIGKPVAAEVIGPSVQVYSDDPSFLAALRAIAPTATGAFAPYAYDCAVLIALASAQRGSTLPSAIADEMVDVSTGGSVCASFEECLRLLRDGRNIDYSGALGTADLTREGEAQTGRFDLFEIVDGTDETIDQFVMTR